MVTVKYTLDRPSCPSIEFNLHLEYTKPNGYGGPRKFRKQLYDILVQTINDVCDDPSFSRTLVDLMTGEKASNLWADKARTVGPCNMRTQKGEWHANPNAEQITNKFSPQKLLPTGTKICCYHMRVRYLKSPQSGATNSALYLLPWRRHSFVLPDFSYSHQRPRAYTDNPQEASFQLPRLKDASYHPNAQNTASTRPQPESVLLPSLATDTPDLETAQPANANPQHPCDLPQANQLTQSKPSDTLDTAHPRKNLRKRHTLPKLNPAQWPTPIQAITLKTKNCCAPKPSRSSQATQTQSNLTNTSNPQDIF